MRIAFHAPLKPPDHPVPSGDRRMGQLLMEALGGAGHRVALVSRFRSRDGEGDAGRQARLEALGGRLAGRLVRRFLARPPEARPELWFTYHLYHKAPDHLGPAVSAALGIPYVVAEASHAGKQAAGPWAIGHAAAGRAIAAADLVIHLNSADTEGVAALRPAAAASAVLPPFLDTGPFLTAALRRATHRATLAQQLALPADEPWLLCVAMMRPDKRASYRLLVEALSSLPARPWRLLIAGDGPDRAAIAAAMARFGDRVRLLGAQDAATLPPLYAAADLLVWPAIGEAYGMALLEAQAAGCAVLAGRTGGVGDIVEDGRTGQLVPVGDGAAFAAALAGLLGSPLLCRMLGQGAQRAVLARHSLASAAGALDRALQPLVAAPVPPGGPDSGETDPPGADPAAAGAAP